MHHAVLLLIIVICSTYSTVASSSIWTVCYESSRPTTSNSDKYFGGFSPATVPAANMPLGAVVWRSSDISIEVTCERLAVAAARPSPVIIFQEFRYGSVSGLRPGYTYQGIDRIMSGGKLEYVNTPYMLGPNIGDKVSFTLTISLNIQRWRDNDVPTSGPAWNGWQFPPVKVQVPGLYDYRSLYIYGGNPGVTLSDCGADVRISSNTIDFGEVSAFRAVNGGIAKQIPFEISSSRSCKGSFKVNATLKPLTSNSYARGDFLVPSQNDSIGIRIRNQGSGEIFPFNQKKELADLTSATSQTNRYVAEAVWQTDKPKLGRFEAGATLQIEYQ
ncbi:fimbrial protein [Burkholderia ubonensis]|uniref:fimbrial protein n=1 Tax=Burkholderia ubonensis TaxID=101571 RepID=UPI0009B48795|nr:fimbrial protein [Burkholderia ubonensis]